VKPVYLITSHTLPGQVLRLASVLRRGSPDASIVVHHDNRTSELDRARAAELAIELIEPPSRVKWGHVSHLAMLIRCLRRVLQSGDFDWLVLLSGQDYPIRPVAEIELSLAQAQVDAFIETAPCPRPASWRSVDEFALRYHYRWRRTGRASLIRAVHAAARLRPPLRVRRMPTGENWIGWPALRSPFGPGFVCHSGADWFTLSRLAAETIERVLESRPELFSYYRQTLEPSESCFQTILANAPALRLAPDHRRYVVFEAQGIHPRVLTRDDLEAILASGRDFARKFDASIDSRALDEIDRRFHDR
jgi:hypothetical protein